MAETNTEFVLRAREYRARGATKEQWSFATMLGDACDRLEQATGQIESMAGQLDQSVEALEEKQERIEQQNKENERLKKWQIKPTEAICLTDLSCRYKKVFKCD